jgi:hypothetical protein
MLPTTLEELELGEDAASGEGEGLVAGEGLGEDDELSTVLNCPFVVQSMKNDPLLRFT